MRHDGALRRLVRHNGAALILAAGLFALVYKVVFNFRLGDSDYIDHMVWALGMDWKNVLAVFTKGSERLWNIFVFIVMRLGVRNSWKAVALVTAAADTVAYFIVYKTFDRALPEKFPRWLTALVTAAVFVASAITWPGGSFYSGRGAVNTWHNPTNIMVRPFAAAVFYMTVNIYNRRRFGQHTALVIDPPADSGFSFEGGFFRQFRQPVYKTHELILYPVCLLLSTYAKPSFLQVFAPAIFVLLVIDVIRTKGMLLPFCIKLALAYVPAAFIVLKQFLWFFDGNVTVASTPAAAEAVASQSWGMAIYYIRTSFDSVGQLLGETGQYWLMTALLCAFPLFILLIAPRRGFGSVSMRLGFITVIAARLETMFLHETGSRSWHGNFSWGYYIAVWLFFTAAVGHYLTLLPEKTTAGKLARWGGTALLAWHVVSGAVYVAMILRTGYYTY